MFTGLIEAVGRVGQVAPAGSGLRIGIRTAMAADLSDGESVSVNGVCLTAAQREADAFYADIGPETSRVTTLGSLQADQPVNLERAMRADSRFGGHFVQGHVDGLGTVRDIRSEGDAHWLTVGVFARAGATVRAQGLDCRGRGEPDRGGARAKTISMS